MKRDSKHRAGLQNLRSMVRIRMRRQASDLAHDFSHVERTWRNARKIAQHAIQEESWTIDGDVLEAAVLLHVIGRGSERMDEHPAEASARVAEELLRSENMPDLVWPVCEVIITFDPEYGRDAETGEAMVLRDAYNLDALGAIGVTRSILTAARRAVPALYDLDDPLARERGLDDGAYVFDVFPRKLFTLQEGMHTAFSRMEAERRTRVVRAFYEAVLRESGFEV